MRELTRASQAMSDETRIRILNLILKRECCVCEVMQALNISLTRASRNLKILWDAGFLNMRNDGLFTLYSINSDVEGSFYRRLLQAVKENLQNNPITQNDLKQLKKTKRVGVSCSVKLGR